MGVYIVKSKHANWVKLGHHKITERRPNVFFRYIGRGFNSCIHPDEITGKLNFEDIELLHWFPNLATKDEMSIHRVLRKFTHVGEWYKLENLNDVICAVVLHGGLETIVDNEKEIKIARELIKKDPWYDRFGY